MGNKYDIGEEMAQHLCIVNESAVLPGPRALVRNRRKYYPKWKLANACYLKCNCILIPSTLFVFCVNLQPKRMDKKALKKAQKEAQKRTSVREFPDGPAFLVGTSNSGRPTKRLRCDDPDSPMAVATSPVLDKVSEDQANNPPDASGSNMKPDEQVTKQVYRPQVLLLCS